MPVPFVVNDLGQSSSQLSVVGSGNGYFRVGGNGGARISPAKAGR